MKVRKTNLKKIEETNWGRNLKVGNRPGDRLPHSKIVKRTVSPIKGCICTWRGGGTVYLKNFAEGEHFLDLTSVKLTGTVRNSYCKLAGTVRNCGLIST